MRLKTLLRLRTRGQSSTRRLPRHGSRRIVMRSLSLPNRKPSAWMMLRGSITSYKRRKYRSLSEHKRSFLASAEGQAKAKVGPKQGLILPQREAAL